MLSQYPSMFSNCTLACIRRSAHPFAATYHLNVDAVLPGPPGFIASSNVSDVVIILQDSTSKSSGLQIILVNVIFASARLELLSMACNKCQQHNNPSIQSIPAEFSSCYNACHPKYPES